MFSPEASFQSLRSSQRNPRRRPRNPTETQQVQPRRKRSKLGDDTFMSLGDDTSDSNGNGSTSVNGYTRHSSVESGSMLDGPGRERKGLAKRVFREDTALYLNKNENYSVKRLPSFPAALAGGATPFRASALTVAGIALALTSDQALVWDYASATGVTKVFALPLPPALKGADPLPLGEIVPNGPTNDFGLVAVAPSTGRIVFWESIDSAEARSVFAQRKQGLEATLKLYSGERITQLVNIDHAGYILVLSSGRLAQLTLRDAQGRPSIATAVLNSPNGSTGSFFSFRGILGGATRKTIASVKARPSNSKGQMEVIAATRNGVFQLWDLNWSGQQIFKHEIDAREEILRTLQQGVAAELRGQQDVHVLDFVVLDRSQEPGVADLLVLIALSGRNTLDHTLLEVDITERGAIVSRAIPLDNYFPMELPNEVTGTLLVPDPGHTAIVQLPDAMVVASLARPTESPDAQLFADSGVSATAFQDSIYFKSDAHVRVVGHALEPLGRKTETCNALVFIQDFGILQVSAYAPPRAEEQDASSKVTAMSKLTQATFFSTVPGTILDFASKGRYSFSQQDVEEAAAAISSGILASSFEHLEGNALLFEDQLRKRAAALKTLNLYLRDQFADLSFQRRWHLLWHAEKLAAATALWDWYQSQLRKKEKQPELFPDKNIMIDIVASVYEKFKTPIDESTGETDPVRQFFTKDVNSMEIMLPWTWNHFRLFYISPQRTKPLNRIMRRLHQADEVLLTAFETAFEFRKKNFAEYGLDPEDLDDDGILKAGRGYDKLTHNFWTSNHNVTASVRSIVDAGVKYSDDCYEKHEQEVLAQEVAQHNARLVRLSCRNHIERFRWALDQNDEKRRSTGRSLQEEWNDNIRSDQIAHLASIGFAPEAMNIAEHYDDMSTLVDLIWDEFRFLENASSEEHSKMIETEIHLKLQRLKDRVAHCFATRGGDFVEAYFSKFIALNQSGLLLFKAQQDTQDFQSALTKFLNARPSRMRLGWINSLWAQKAYDKATIALWKAAEGQEVNIWCDTVELSIARLSTFATEETVSKPTGPEPASKNARAFLWQIDNELEVVKIQNQLYERMLPTIKTAMDAESAVQLLMTDYGQRRLADRPSLQLLLQQGFEQLVQHQIIEPRMLIDILTLVTPDEAPETWNPFALALKVLAMHWSKITKHPNVAKGLVGLIWKRTLLQDDWKEINSTQNLSNEAMAEYLGQTVTGSTLKAFLEWRTSKGGEVFARVEPSQVQRMYGAGCTDNEYAVRFPSEDLRQPIIQDNLLDEAEIKDLVDNHRLENWFQACMRAADSDGQGEVYDPIVEDQEATELPDAEPVFELAEPAVGDVEPHDQDVEMQGS